MAEGNEGENISLVQAIENKYSLEEDDGLAIQIFVPKSAPGQKKDTGEIIVPQELSLHKAKINCAGEKDKVTSLCHKVTLLDLSENKLSDWKEVFAVLDSVPRCSFLDLRLNPLCHTIDCLEDNQQYTILSKLVLNDVGLPWPVITKLLNVFPNLFELHLSLNQYNSVDIPANLTYPELRFLHFNSNNVSNWQEISKLGKAFPNLDTLMLLANPLKTLPALNTEDLCRDFPKLKTLSLSKTDLADWDELQKLRYFPSLTQIRLKEIPFLEQYPEQQRRQLLLSYLPQITNLNGGKLQTNEREEAERAFIRYYMDREEPLPSRYHELISIHGKLPPLVEVDMTVEKTVNVTVHFDRKTVLTEICLDWTTVDLKKTLQSLTGYRPKDMLLHLDDDAGWHKKAKMMYANRTMSRYGIREGDQILVYEKLSKQK